MMELFCRMEAKESNGTGVGDTAQTEAEGRQMCGNSQQLNTASREYQARAAMHKGGQVPCP